MKFKRDNNGMVYIQNKPKERYKILYHRLNQGKYELFYKDKDYCIVLTQQEKDEYKNWLKDLVIEDGKQ